MMLLSWKHKFLFVHVPKTGGTTITNALAPYARFADQFSHRVVAAPGVRTIASAAGSVERLIESITGANAHATLDDLESAFGKARLAGLFKFGFVRNPYALAYSYYHHVRRRPDHEDYKAIGGHTFHEALEPICTNRMCLQTPYLFRSPRFNAGADFVGSLENFSEDFRSVCEQIGIATPPLVALNQNPAPPENLADAFGGRTSQFLEAYRFEFERLGYSTNIQDANNPPIKNT